MNAPAPRQFKLGSKTIIALTIWALLTFVAWHYDSPCGAILTCGTELWRAARYVVLFKWLKDYQEALGGVATLIAAIVAYRAVIFQIRQEKSEAEAKQNERIRKTVNLVALEFSIASSNIEGGYEGVWHSEKVWRSNVVGDVAEFNPELLEVFRYAENLIDIDLREADEMSKTVPPSNAIIIENRKKRAAAKAMAAHSIFLDAAAFVGHPPSSFKSYFDARGIQRYLRKRRLNRDHLRDLRHYFDWDKLDQTTPPI